MGGISMPSQWLQRLPRPQGARHASGHPLPVFALVSSVPLSLTSGERLSLTINLTIMRTCGRGGRGGEREGLQHHPHQVGIQTAHLPRKIVSIVSNACNFCQHCQQCIQLLSALSAMHAVVISIVINAGSCCQHCQQYMQLLLARNIRLRMLQAPSAPGSHPSGSPAESAFSFNQEAELNLLCHN